MRKPLKIGNKTYKFKKDAIAHYRKILNSYDFGESLNNSDFEDLIDLIIYNHNNRLAELEFDEYIYDELDSFNYDDSLFDHSEDDKPSFNEIGSNHRRLATPKVSRKLKHFQIKYSNAKKLAQDIDLVNNDRYDVILAGNFIYGDFLQFLFYENMIQAKEMFVSTLSMSYDNVYAFKNLIEKNYLLKLDLIVSDYFFSHERNKIIKAIYEELDIDNKFQLSTAQTHSKVCFFETHTGDKIVIHGSANLSSSNNVEQITIEKNEQLYDFYKEFYSKIIEKYKTINKSVLTSTSKSEFNDEEIENEIELDDNAEVMEKQEKHFPRRWSAYLFNMIILSLFFYIFIREDYPIRLTKRINLIFTPTATEPKKYSYKHNNKFHEKTDLFTLYGNKKDIIMLGASIIERVDWNELLSRNDIANRGIGSDITEGYLNRLNSIFHLSPKLCFIQGGGNDLSKGIPQREIIYNLNKLTDTLKSNNMSCILMAVNYVTKEVSEKDSFNLKVHNLNKEIYKIAKQKNIDIIDINPIIAPNRSLQKEYSIKDGIHLNSKAYALWKNEIEKIIGKKLSASP